MGLFQIAKPLSYSVMRVYIMILIKKYLTVLLFISFFSFSVLGADTVRIMPLGDSITYGADHSPGAVDASIAYRGSLWTKLHDAGYTIDFVGDVQAGSDYQIFDPSFDLDNEGHWGWRADEIALHVTDYLTANPPDIILLHIGTNDLHQGQDITSTVNDVSTILDDIHTFDPSIKVIVARIINQQIYDQQTTDYNSALETMLQNRITDGEPIAIVDMENGAGIDYANDMLDNFHPNSTGNSKLADQWYAVLTTLLPAQLHITTEPVTAAALNVPYAYDVNSSNDPLATFVLNLSPSWMNIDTDTGLITGVPDATGDFEIEVEVMDGTQTDVQNYMLNVTDTSLYPNNLQHYWKLDESGGSPYLDAYLHADATCTGDGCPLPVTGEVNGAQSFDGDDELTVADSTTFNWSSDDSFSIAFWIKTGTDTVHGKNNTIMSRRSNSNAPKLAWFISVDRDNSGKILFGLSDSNDGWSALSQGTVKTRGTTVVKDNVWHYVVCIRDAAANENRIYVDGVLDGSKQITYDTDFNEGSLPVYIGHLDWDWGSQKGGYHYQGLLDEVGVFNTALSPAEIQQYYSDGLAGNGIGGGTGSDTTPPVITRIGTESISITQGSTYIDQGATANDNVDGDITADIVTHNPVDTNSVGTYTVTYDVNDTAGNAAIQMTRTVTVTAEQTNSSLDHYWKLDESGGSPYLDAYLHADATCTGDGCPLPVTGEVNGAQSFDGDDELTVADSTTFNWSSDDSFSIAFWIKTGTDTVHGKNNTIMSRRSNSNAPKLAWFISVDRDNSGKILFGLSDSNDGWSALSQGTVKTRGTTVVKDNVWHYVVCIRDAAANENRIYVDGVLDGSKQITYDTDFNEGSLPVYIGHLDWDWGSQKGGYHYQGLLDEVGVFNTALSPAEIQQYYSDGLAGNGL